MFCTFGTTLKALKFYWKKKDNVDPKPLNENQPVHIEYVKGEEKKIGGCFRTKSLLNIPESEVADEKSKKGRKGKILFQNS